MEVFVVAGLCGVILVAAFNFEPSKDLIGNINL